MTQYEFFLVSSLEKVFADQTPTVLTSKNFTALNGDTISVQLVYKQNDTYACAPMQHTKIIVENAPCGFEMRKVELMPSNLPTINNPDENYLRTAPGLYPDLLKPFNGYVKMLPYQYRAVWIDIPIKDLKAGNYDVTIKTQFDANSTHPQDFCETITIEVIDATLPKDVILHTEWFHADCIANYYNVEVFSDKFWDYIEKAIDYAYNKCAMNMILTPIFTPPLDTQEGGERTTVQLIGVKKIGDNYEFDFSKLERWCDICKKAGITHIEVSHLFTQWGGYQTPKIIADVDGKEEKIFGWHVASKDPSYKTFLEQLIPQLLACLTNKGYTKETVYFHVSDEPADYNQESYKLCKSLIKDMLEGYKIVDALSSVEFFKKGLVEVPIPANDHIESFVNEDISERWVYYCIAQNRQVPNRFFSMPSARNRIMGVLCYLYNIDGFLHWGYNFYSTQFSTEAINPYEVTDAGMAFNSGDSFLVYPAKDGEIWGSIRNEVQMQAFRDLSALKLLESLTDRKTVEELVQEGVGYKMTFKQYPKTDYYLTTMREKVNQAIKNAKK